MKDHSTSDEILFCVECFNGSTVERYLQGELQCSYAAADMYKIIEDGTKWAFSHPSKNRMVLLSCHGTGIIDPEPDVGRSGYTDYCNHQLYKRMHQIYQLQDTKASFQLDVHKLRLPRVDILGLDACHMAMLEVADVVQPYARYLVASEDIENKTGWPLKEVAQLLKSASVWQVARSLVATYQAYHCTKSLRYSLSALDLRSVDEVKLQLAIIIEACYTLPSKKRLYEARSKNSMFCLRESYADLMSFYQDLLEALDAHERTVQVADLQQLLIQGIAGLNRMIIANGASIPLLKGCSIYFPTSYKSSSYTWQHPWNTFLDYFIAVDSDYSEPEVCEV